MLDVVVVVVVGDDVAADDDGAYDGVYCPFPACSSQAFATFRAEILPPGTH